MINSNKFVPRHILVKCLKAKDKEKILKAEREREAIPYLYRKKHFERYSF